MSELVRQATRLPRVLVIRNVKLTAESFKLSGTTGDVKKGTLRGGAVVALKRLRVTAAQKEQAVFYTKLRDAIVIWRQLQHPNVLSLQGLYGPGVCTNGIMKIGEVASGTSLYLVSPWMPNGNVVGYLETHGPDANKLLKLSSDIANGLSYIHEFGLIHGDMRAVNVLVDSQGNPKITDYGILPIYNESQVVVESPGSMVITRYAAPELFGLETRLDLPARQAADVFAFGCVCFEMYTLKLPFPDVEKDTAVPSLVIKGKRHTLPTARDCPFGQPPPEMSRIMEQCWAEKSDARPSARDIVNRDPSLIQTERVGDHIEFETDDAEALALVQAVAGDGSSGA
ncbi:kinase-like protein [Punctularia strigosozonata HHB-11173 SS5]|uniref:kinase-like protein n=1 Tax=Punctularia strigosozonata (strain HHB-11173) TaxID=741275 RepID=UPI00044184C5|nr:kinase-like protein [Punctularia strigosozonata HHB-11173 SS5]EIN09326.1 kinase-like protein [Punctularia strigosozonata HHB-11173 SS5]